jgi:hypothetical protein
MQINGEEIVGRGTGWEDFLREKEPHRGVNGGN